MKSKNAQFRHEAKAALYSADDALRLITEGLSEVRPRCVVFFAMNAAQAERKRIRKVLTKWKEGGE